MIVKQKKYSNGSIKLIHDLEAPEPYWRIEIYYKKSLIDRVNLVSENIAESVFLKYKEVVEKHLSQEFKKVVNKLKGEKEDERN